MRRGGDHEALQVKHPAVAIRAVGLGPQQHLGHDLVGDGDVSALAWNSGGNLLGGLSFHFAPRLLCLGGSLRHASDHLPLADAQRLGLLRKLLHGLVELLLSLHLGLQDRRLDSLIRDGLHLGRKHTHLLDEVLICRAFVQALCHLVDATAHNVPGLGRLEREGVPHDVWDGVQTRDGLLEALLLVRDSAVLDQVTHLRQLVLHVFEDRRGTLLQHLLDMLRQLLDGGQGIFCTLQFQLVVEALGLRMDPIPQLLVSESEWHRLLPQARGLGKSQAWRRHHMIGSLCIRRAARVTAAACLCRRLAMIEDILQR
mmetsp:Transcript_96841/g.273335  ORF Transcript_96841/g.273335 Transcript_96841/m.273335 type:complete len:313 (+) Transcript_96841:532-1470(+)